MVETTVKEKEKAGRGSKCLVKLVKYETEVLARYHEMHESREDGDNDDGLENILEDCISLQVTKLKKLLELLSDKKEKGDEASDNKDKE